MRKIQYIDPSAPGFPHPPSETANSNVQEEGMVRLPGDPDEKPDSENWLQMILVLGKKREQLVRLRRNAPIR